MIGYYNFSVIVTYFSLMLSVGGICAALTGHIQAAFVCIMVCGMCDMVDGPIARKCKRTEDEKSFGIQIDSLCDLICFGAQAAVLSLVMGGISWYSTLIAAFFVLAGVIRLGYFNVQEINRVRRDPGRRQTYDGLPITSSSIILPLVGLIDILVKARCSWIYPVTLAVTGLMYILPVRIPKLHTRGMIVCGIGGAVMFALMVAFGAVLQAA